MASYLVKAPLSLKKLVYLDDHKAVVYRSKMNPALGRNFEAMDPLEWLARLADHIPDPGKHRTLAYGHYSNRARGARVKEKAQLEGAPAEAPKKRRCSPNWARLIPKVYPPTPSSVSAAEAASRSWPTSPTSGPSDVSSSISA